MNKEMLVPQPWHGTVDVLPFNQVAWLKNLPKNTYCGLWLGWGSKDVPLGHNLYVFSFHLEAIDVDWVVRQSQRVSAPVILLSDLNYYDYPFPENVFTYTYYYWHEQVKLITQWHPDIVEKELNYKASAFCNRITQSKLLTFTALAEYFKSDCLLKLDDWLEEKNVHFYNTTGITIIDQLTDIFRSKYWGKKYQIDEFVNANDNHQKFTSNPYSKAYNQALINFTNESFHYSFHQTDHTKFIYPGPFLTEKTLKCLVGGTPFIAVGQFETYKSLKNVGFKFDYEPIDISWDNDPGNLTRLQSIIMLIKDLEKYQTKDLLAATKTSNDYNQQYCYSGEFYKTCQNQNISTIEKIFKEIPL